MSRTALLSVSDRTGLVELARGIQGLGFTILSTGGTASHLQAAHVPVQAVRDLTGFPEVFSGRVKTLHPKLFGGILFDRSLETHRREAETNSISPIDLVVVNLYPFEEFLAKGGDFGATLEKIDVGGPALLRAAAKNHAHVAVVCDPADYSDVLAELRDRGGSLSGATRLRLAAKVFRRTAAYDASIARWLTAEAGDALFPERLVTAFALAGELRYGENPHQRGARYADARAPAPALSRYEFVQGKELSYNNLLDADAALFTSRAIGAGALTLVKHRIPSGAATAPSMAAAFERAWESDPVSGFGGVMAFTGVLDADGARAITSRFLEVVVAHAVTDEARAILAKKPNLRVLTVAPEAGPRARLEMRGIDGGLLVQEGDLGSDDPAAWRAATKRPPTEAERAGLVFANRVVRGVISNAIVVADATATLGIGGGRTSRVDACRDAILKAGARAKGAVAASDAFFPFPDGLQVLIDAGVTAVVQPGGSVRDSEVIAAADAAGIAMLFTGKRHFRH